MFQHQLSMLCLLLSILTSSSVSTAQPTQPNVMIILADDVGTGDVPGYWNTGLVDMPNLEDLVANGVTFTDAHSTPYCAPSRYMLLSGNYPHRGSEPQGTFWLNYDQGGQFLPGQQSIAEVFRDNGYTTAIFGKWGIGGKMPTYSNFSTFDKDEETLKRLGRYHTMSTIGHDWTKPFKGSPKDIGFHRSLITLEGIESSYAFLKNGKFLDDDLQNVTFWEKGRYLTSNGESEIAIAGDGAADWDSTQYNMILVNKTNTFIKYHLQKMPGKPFFTYVALGSVHKPHTPANKYSDGTQLKGQYPTAHMDVLHEVDKVVGSLVDHLKYQGVLNNTIIVFSSDNGGLGHRITNSSKYGHHSNGPLRGNKGSIHEGGHTIPMILRWDDGLIPKGEKRSHLIGLNDLFATLTDMVGIQKPSRQAVDSISFAKYVFNETNQIGLREYFGIWKHRFSTPEMLAAALRKGSLKLEYNFRTKKSKLFDLSQDQSEENDISSQNELLVNEMKQILRQIGPCVDRGGKFKVTHRRNPNATKTCRYMAKKKSRCKKFSPDAKINCGKTCSSSLTACSYLVE